MPVRHKPARKIKPKRPETPGAWPLLIIDSTPIRNAAREQYETAIREVDEAKAIRHRFHNHDRPLYQKWLSSRFGALLTELRELHVKLGELESLVDEVEGEFFFGDYDSLLDAYENVMKRRNKTPDAPGDEAEDEKEWKELFGEDDEMEEWFKEFFDSMFGENQSGDSEPPGKKSRSKSPARSGHGSDHSRLKSLYRELARRLHPDQAENPTPQHVEWWLETQQAYEAGNVERLEIILTLTELEQPGARQSSVSILQKVTAHIKKSLQLLKSELRQFRKDPAWNFSALKKRDAMEKRTEKTLLNQKAEAVELIADYQARVQLWEQLLQRKPGVRAKKRKRKSI